MSDEEAQTTPLVPKLVSLSLLQRAKVLLFSHQFVSEAINTDYMYKWTPATPIFISAQTGSGKNTFIEDVIIRQVVKLNGKILILSNRIALGRQEKKRIAEIMDRVAPRKNSYNSYSNDVEKRRDVPAWLDELEDFGAIRIKSYQGFLAKEETLADHYDFIIFDECHFFLADARFNKYTYRVLDTILKRYPYSIRLYMTATPDEVVSPIIKAESSNIPSKLDVPRRVTPFGLKGIQKGQIYWDIDNSSYTLIDYNIRKECEPLYTKKYAYMYGTGEQWHDTYETYNNYSAVIYEFERDYSYINCKYLKANKAERSSGTEEESKIKIVNQCQPMLDLIKTQVDDASSKINKEKWLIFVTNKEDGHDLLEAIGHENADYIDAGSKTNNVYAKICNEGKFDKKVLITTSVIDNGVNIIDSLVKHVAIFVFDKVSFLQMLGRKRVKPNEKITLYLTEQTRRGLNWRMQESDRVLERIRKAKNNYEDVIKHTFDKDTVFFYTGHGCNSNSLVTYNRFLESKLQCDIAFLKNLLNNNGTGIQALKADYSQDKNYEQYVQGLKCKDNSTEEIGEDIDSFGERTIVEQLSWIGQEDSFNKSNYLESRPSAENEEEMNQSKNRFMQFIETYVEEKVPDDGSEAADFYREKGMNIQRADHFCNEFTKLYVKAFGPRSEDKNNKIYGKSVINKCFKAQSLPYEIISQSVKLNLEQKSQHNTDKENMTFWILKKKLMKE